MTQAPDETMPQAGSYRETYRRHRLLCWAPVVLGAAVAAVILLTTSTSYQSTASLWVDTAPPATSSIGAQGNSSSTEPPASAEQGILAELLTTDAFAESVVKSSSAGDRLTTPAAIRAEARKLVEHGQVGVVVTGGQILKLSYTGHSRALAVSVLGGIVTQLRRYNDSLTAAHDQAGLGYDRQQVKLAEAALQTANGNVSAYLKAHGKADRTDPTYLSLTAAANNAVNQLEQANTTLTQAAGSPNAGGWTIHVLDPPGPALSRAPGKKKLVEVILGGAFGGLLISLLAVLALTPARKEPWEDELPVGEPTDSDGFDDGLFPGRSLPIMPRRRRPLVAVGARGERLNIDLESLDES